MSEKTAVIYARVSDRKQANEDVSVPTQIELATKRAAELGARVLRVFTDGGRSAFKESNRRIFEAAVEFSVTMGVTHFLTWSSSRFARNRFEAVYYKRELDRAGVQLVYLSSTIDRKTDEGWLLDSMFEIVDEMASRQTAKDTRRSMIRNSQKGYWAGGQAPFGYQIVPAADVAKRKVLVPHPEESLVVREIFERRALGTGAMALVIEFKSRGIQRRGTGFTKQTMLNILRSEAYVGVRVFNRRDRSSNRDRPRDEWIVVPSHEAIISPELFDQVQKAMTRDSDRTLGSPKSTHPFTGILKCEHCGSSLQIETGKGNGGHYSYYRCRSAQQGRGCRGRRVRADRLDRLLTEEIFSQLLNRKNLEEAAAAIAAEQREWSLERNGRRKAVLEQIGQLEQRNQRLYSILELQGKEAPNLGDLTKRLRANNAEIKDAEASLLALDAEAGQAKQVLDADLAELEQFFRAALADGNNAGLARELYRGFIHGIVVGDDHADIHYDPVQLLGQAAPVHSRVNWRPVLASLRTRDSSPGMGPTRVLRISLDELLGPRRAA